jgi:hypothetical protein
MSAGKDLLETCSLSSADGHTPSMTELLLFFDAKDSLFLSPAPSQRVMQQLHDRAHRKEWKMVPLRSDSNASGTTLYGTHVHATIPCTQPRFGYISGIYLSLPYIENTTRSHGFMYFKYIDEVVLKINKKIVEKQTGEAQQLWAEKSTVAATCPLASSGILVAANNVLLSLPFWFCRHQYSGIDQTLLKTNSMDVDILFQNRAFNEEQCSFETPPPQENTFTLATVGMYVEYTYFTHAALPKPLSTHIHIPPAAKSSSPSTAIHMMEMFETVAASVQVDATRRVVLSLDKLKYPLKQLTWTICTAQGREAVEYARASLIINKIAVIHRLPRVFLSHVFPSEHAVEFRASSNTVFAGYYAFAIDPQLFTSTGYLNVEKFKDMSLIIELHNAVPIGESLIVQCHALCYDWLVEDLDTGQIQGGLLRHEVSKAKDTVSLKVR